MVITYATPFAPHDVHAWSGTAHHIAKALEATGLHLDHFGDLQRRRVLLNKAIGKLYGLAVPGSLYPAERTIGIAREMARDIVGHMEAVGSDLVLSPSSIPIALMRSTRPKVFYTDATFAGILALYPEYRNYSPRHIKEGHALERAALRNADLAIYSSEWAARTAIEEYGADPGKIRVLPFGSNFTDVPDRAEVGRMIARRPMDRCELLFLAVNWERKGGQRALEVAAELERRGMKVRLRIVGVEPPVARLPRNVEVIPFISKHSIDGQKRLSALLARSHFLILPTVADCTPIVFSEANSFGLPCLTTRVGGVPDVVRSGVNGLLFGLDAGAEVWADAIERAMASPSSYATLATDSLNEYHERLNWDTTGRRLRGWLEDLL